MEDTIDRIVKKNHIGEAFVKLTTHGIANEIYASQSFILRIPSEHPEARADAFTEAIAAPLAKTKGIKTPELICFDDSYTILDKTYSIWERIHGFTLGEVDNYLQLYNTFREIGFELGKIHVNINSCEDPKGWLDSPERDYSKDLLLQGVLESPGKASYLLDLIESRYRDTTFSYKKSFVHGDTNVYNFLCTKSDQLLSIIDWGDSGWGDPAMDFYMLPIEAIHYVLDGYSNIAGNNIDLDFIYRIILDKIWTGIEEKQDIGILEKSIKELEKKLLSILYMKK